MRHAPIGPDGPRRDGPPPRASARRPGGRWLPGLAMLAAMAAPAVARAQAPAPGGSLASGAAGPAVVTPLARYFPRDNLVFYLECSGLDAHADAWQKTAACKMLTETPLGEMLEIVGAQLLDKVVGQIPGYRLNGKETVALAKYAAHHGFAVGVHLKPSPKGPSPDSFALTIVFRGAAAREMREVWARSMRLVMVVGSKNVRLEKRQGRTLVLSLASGAGQPDRKEGGHCWWAERDDLVIAARYPWAADGVMAALDGKAPSAVDHPIVKELSARDGSFEPEAIAFFDVEHAPAGPGGPAQVLGRIRDEGGIRRVAYRFGFDDDALMQELRIAAPRPRKPFLALFDQPGFDAKGMMPLPQGVESFVELAIDPNALIDSLEKLGPAGGVRAKVDEVAESIRSSGKIDLRKDFLGHIGPRIVLFLAPDRSAAVGGSFETSWLQGLSPQAGLPTALLSQTKLTVLAEVSDPRTFARTLEGAVNAVNHLMEEKTAALLEQEDADPAAPGAGEGSDAAGAAAEPGGRRPGGQRPGGGRAGGQRGTRKRSIASQSPHFVPMLDTRAAVVIGSSSGQEKRAYILRTPSDSPLKVVPPKFHPVIMLEGKYLVISVAADSAEAALKATQQKHWQPPEDLRKAGEHLPAKMVVLAVSDPREIMPAMLASLPKTLQTTINTAIAVARGRAAGTPPGPAAGGMGMPPRGRRFGPGGGAMPPRGDRGGSDAANGPDVGGGNAPDIPADAMVELKVDADKLPKADDLRSRYFLSTVAVAATDEDIRLVTREAFLSLYDVAALGGLVGGLLPAVQAARAAQAAAAPAEGEQAPAGSEAGGAPGPGGPMRPGGPGMPGRPGGPGGRRGGRGGPGGARPE